MRKTLRVEDDLDHMIDVIKAKALLDRREKITYTSVLNLLLLIGLDAFPSKSRWTEIYEEGKSASYDLEPFFDRMEEKVRRSDVPEDFLKFDYLLGVYRERTEELTQEDSEDFP